MTRMLILATFSLAATTLPLPAQTPNGPVQGAVQGTVKGTAMVGQGVVQGTGQAGQGIAQGSASVARGAGQATIGVARGAGTVVAKTGRGAWCVITLVTAVKPVEPCTKPTSKCATSCALMMVGTTTSYYRPQSPAQQTLHPAPPVQSAFVLQ
jgi:hypothetical protein